MKNALEALILTALLAGLASAAAARPRVGLVLGGGGARGAAHIGVLEVLKERRVPVDCVAGTSMGALTAGAYAAGISAKEMLTELGGADWNDMFEDNLDSTNLSYRQTRLSQTFLPGLELGVGGGGVKALPGAVDGQKIKFFFNKLVRSNLGERRIEWLALPLSIIATDIGSGERVVFHEGSLTKAMRASMSVPGLMAPISYHGRKLVDGGLVDNVPIGEARERCQADVVIAVNVGSPLLKPEDVGSAVTVAAQMVNILTEQNVSQSLAKLRPADIYIKPDLDGVTAADFAMFREAAARGRAAAEAVADRLAALAVDQAAYDAWWNRIATTARETPRVDEIQIVGRKRVSDEFVRRHLAIRAGDRMDTERLEADLLRVYGEGHFESVDYSLLPKPGQTILRVAPVEKSWGPDYLRFGVNIDSAVGHDSTYNVRVGYHRTWVNALGGEWLTTLQLGNLPGIHSEWYQPLDRRQRFFVQPGLSYQNRPFPVYQDNRRIAERELDESTLDLRAGYNVDRLGPIHVGWQGRHRKFTLNVGTAVPTDDSQRLGGWLAGLDFDRMNRLHLPSQGWAARASYFESPSAHYGKAEADLRAAVPLGSMVLHGRLHAVGSPKGELPIFDAASLGGFLNLSGFVKGQVVGDSVRYGHLRIEQIIGQMPLGIRGDMRLGMAIEAGRVDGRYTEQRLGGWQGSTALYLGGETPLGALYIGWGYAPRGMSNLFLFIGTP